MKNRTKSLLTNTAILTVSNFATKFLSFFFVPLYTGLLSTTEYGIYDFLCTSVSLLFPVLSLNIVDAVMRYCIDNNYSKLDVGKIGAQIILIGNGIVFLAGIVLFASGKFLVIRRYAIWFVLIYFISSLQNFFIQYAKGCEKVFALGAASVISTAFTIGFNILFLVVIRIGLTGLFLANIISGTITCIFYFYKLEIIEMYKVGIVNRELLKIMLLYCVPLIVTALSWWVNSSADKYVISFFYGLSINGLIAMAYKIPNILNTLQTIFIQAWQISAMKEYGREEANVFYGQTISIVNFLMCISCGLLIVLNRPIANILFLNDFYTAWMFVPYLLMTSVINCTSGLLGPILCAGNRSIVLMWSAVIGAICNVFANIFFIYFWGAQGVPLGTLFASIVIFLIRYYYARGEVANAHMLKECILWMLLFALALVELLWGNYWVEILIVLVLCRVDFSIIKKIIALIKHIFLKRVGK